MKNMMTGKRIAAAALALTLFCGQMSAVAAAAPASTKETGKETTSQLLLPEAPGTKVKKTTKATIDYSNVADGYVMVCFTAKSDKKLRAKVVTPSTTNDYYQYVLTAGEWTVIPLSDGDGDYKISVLENTTGNKYSVAASVTVSVKLSDEFAPFLRPNQYVDYAVAEETVAKAAALIEEAKVTEPLDKVKVIYEYVVKNLTYDHDRADQVKKGTLTNYLPVLDSVLAEKKGICFDYAALMTGMLRSQGVPCKLIVGYAGTAYHAWISVWTEEEGWISNAIHFDGTSWHRMDPTYASSSNSSAKVMSYIGDGKNYSMKYQY